MKQIDFLSFVKMQSSFVWFALDRGKNLQFKQI